MVPDTIAGSVTDWLSAEATNPTPGTLVDLLKIAGTLRTGDPQPGNAARFAIPIPQTLASEMARSDIDGPSHLISIIRLVLGTWLGLRFHGFDHMLHRLGRHAIYWRSATDAAAFARLADYDRVRRYVPLARNCLLDSLAQYRWLARNGIRCRLVFGVTGAPFAAHCWLQADEAILNDTYEHVSRFTPIMVI